MPILKKSDFIAPTLPEEVVHVEALGGDVRVRGMLLGARLALFANADAGLPAARLLAACVLDDDGEKLMTETEWEIFGASNFVASMELLAVVRRVMGMDVEVIEKN